MSNNEINSKTASSPEERGTGSRFIDESPSEPAESARTSSTEGFDYVIPERRRHGKHHKHHKHHHSSAQTESTVHADEEIGDFVFVKRNDGRHKHGRRHRKKWPLWLRIIVIIVSILLALAIAVTATYFIMREIGRKAMHDYGNIDISISLEDKEGNKVADVMDSGRTIKYGGKTYLFNEDVMTVTFIGFNQEEANKSNGYMADAIYIAAIDARTGKTTILGVSRDTMLDVDVYSAEGKMIGTEKTQLSYAYSFGNDTITGGKNVNTSLSRLFFGLPLNNYFAIDLNALEDLNEAVGGVTLVSKMTFDSEEYGRTIQEGEEVTLRGKDAVTYVRSRDVKDLKSNNTRMDRQQQYIMALLTSIVPAAKKDLSVVTNLYDVVSKNADSTLDLPKVTYLASTALSRMKNASEIENVRLTGKIKAGEHAEMYVSDKDTLETMLKIFYTPIG